MSTALTRINEPERPRALATVRAGALMAALVGALLLPIAACNRNGAPGGPASASSSAAVPTAAAAVAAGDAYDVTQMDFKTPAAVLSNERHSGPFNSGDALSLDAAVKPLVAAPVKEIRLDTTHKIIEIAPGVKFSAWTFGDQVPGPVVRAKVGTASNSP